MAIDPYTLCPGGTGKKIKFCCSDLVGDLDKVSRMVTGEQFHACLDYLDKLEARFPNRACLTVARLQSLTALDRQEEAIALVERFVAEHPENPIALVTAARLLAATHDAAWGVEMLQKAIELASDGKLNDLLLSGLKDTAAMLLMAGHPMAALSHLQLALVRGADREVAQFWLKVLGDPSIPLPLKDPFPLVDAPANAPWKAEFDAAMAILNRGLWLKAAERLTKLTQRVTSSPAVWRNLAMVRAWLADDDGAARALRRYAALDIPLDDAVDAELLAGILDLDDARKDTVQELYYRYRIANVDELLLRLASDPCAQAMSVDSQTKREDDEPRPKATYLLLDRSRHAADVDRTFDNFPRMLGIVDVYGRRTDREALLEVEVPEYLAPQLRDRLAEVCGDALGELLEETPIARTPAEVRLLQFDGVLPADTSTLEQRDIESEHVRRMLFDVWPDRPQAALGDRTPREAATDPAGRIKVLAKILAFDLHFGDRGTIDLNDLREKLGLPQSERLAPPQDSTDRLALARLHLLDAASLSDADLIAASSRCITTGYARPLVEFADEMVRRDSIPDARKYQAAATLVDIHGDPRVALKFLDMARELTVKAGNSSASWDLRELTLRLQMGETKRFQELLGHVVREHGEEPGIREAVVDLMMRLGIVGQDAHDRHALEPAAAGQTEPAKLWTPESAQPQGQKSGLWIPGAD